MADWIPITAADLAAQANQWQAQAHLLELELRGLTAAETYELIFARLLKPDPFRLFAPEAGPTLMMLGTDQREHFVPRVARALAPLPAGASLLDLGCGDGQSTALVLADRKAPLSIVPLDPNRAYLERYRTLCATALPQVTIPYSLEGSMNALLVEGKPAESFDAAMILHSFHFAEDPQRLLGLILDRLKPGGLLAMVVVARKGGFANEMLRGYLETYQLDPEGRVAARQEKLDDLLLLSDSAPDAGGLTDKLRAELGRDDFLVEAVEFQPTRIYGHDFADLIVVGLITGLLTADEDRPRQIRYVAERLLREPEAYDLRVDLTGPRARMLSYSQPQAFLAFRRH